MKSILTRAEKNIKKENTINYSIKLFVFNLSLRETYHLNHE